MRPVVEEDVQRLVATGAIPGITRSALISALGSGESYSAWRLHDAAADVVLRVPVRDPADLPHPMFREFTALQRVPARFGSHGILLEESADNPLHAPYLVSSYVPGQVLGANQWTAALVAQHARQLARLHHEGLTAASEPLGPLQSALVEARIGVGWWLEHRGDLASDPRIAQCLPTLFTVLGGYEWAAAEITEHPLVHADLVLTNIVIGPDRLPRYIDWEWGGPGDVARDLALFGGEIHAGPWYLPMDRAQVTGFVACYAQQRAALGLNEPEARLLARRDAWELAERFQMAWYLLTRPDRPQYEQWATRLLAGVSAALDQRSSAERS